MAYFPNGTAGDMYEAKYCARCVHRNEERGCAVMLAHMLHNYKECNNEESILHMLIPRDDKGFAMECTMFIEGKPHCEKEKLRKEIAPHYREWAKAKGLI